MIGRKDALLLTVATLGMADLGSAGLAQTVSSPPLVASAPVPQGRPSGQGSTASAGKIEEVIVTAEKRSTRVQKTPIAIETLNSKQLQERHVEEVLDLGNVLPNVQIIPVSQTVQVNIRGIGSNFFDPRGETSVSATIDGLAYARPAQNGNTFFDVSRLEVLNGPQGTLYGTNSAGGAVNLITNQPTNKLEGYGEFSLGNYLEREYAATLNIPITDDLAIRIAGKGFVHNGYIANYYDDADNKAARASAKWTPTENFTAYFSYNYSEFDGNGQVAVSYPCDPDKYSNFVSQRCAPPGAPGGRFPLNGTSNTDLETYNLTLTYDLGVATLTSISGLMTQGIQSANTPNGTFFNVTLGQTSHDYSEEFRIAGKSDGHHAGGLGWVVGAYYSTGNGRNTFSGLGLPTNQPSLPENAEAGFGQGTYGITDQIRATAGIRYTHDERGVVDVYGSNVTAPYDHINYRLGLEGDLAKNSLLYATISTGYVAGGADGGSTSVPTFPGFVPSIFKPENVLSYEIGSKNTFLDGRLLLNGDFYYYIIKNYQSYNPGLLNTGIFGLQIQDIANATTFGGEANAAFALTPFDRLTFAGSLSHGEYGPAHIDSFGLSRFGLGPLLINVPGGYPETNVPSWDVRVGYAHTFTLPDDSTIEAGVDSHISGGYWVVPASNDPFDRQKSYSMTDVHVRYQTRGRITVDGWIKNIENAEVTTYAENPGFHLYYPLPPRTFGITIGYKFF